jgi:hypothetical protein
MAANTDRATAGSLACPNTSSPNRSAASEWCVEESCGSTVRTEDPTRGALDAGYAGRTLRFAYFTRLRRGTAAPRASSYELATPIPPVADRSI